MLRVGRKKKKKSLGQRIGATRREKSKSLEFIAGTNPCFYLAGNHLYCLGIHFLAQWSFPVGRRQLRQSSPASRVVILRKRVPWAENGRNRPRRCPGRTQFHPKVASAAMLRLKGTPTMPMITKTGRAIGCVTGEITGYSVALNDAQCTSTQEGL